jgi:hypothetical protein
VELEQEVDDGRVCSRWRGGGTEKGWKIFRHDGGEAFFAVKYYLMEV